MNINRHNYEEFFLLYVDNELTSAQRSVVESFLQSNPDLRQEMNMFQQVVLEDTSVVYENKNDLYKAETGISLENYEEYFLLYVDEELTPAGRESVEKFVLQHPPLQNAFIRLRAAKLQPEVVEFTNKESLNRTEKERRIIPFNWMRMAAAAAVIGLITMLWINADDTKQAAVTKDIAQQKITVPKQDVPNTLPGVKQHSSIDQTAVDNNSNAQPVISVTREAAQKAKVAKQQDNISNPLPTQENLVALANEMPAEIRKNNVVADPQLNNLSAPGSLTLSSNNDSQKKPVAEYAVYSEPSNDEEDEEDRILYIAGAEINKNKLRGLFKKATSIFDKKSKKSDKENTVQIASFEIKTK